MSKSEGAIIKFEEEENEAKCIECGFSTRDPDKIRNHLIEEHKIDEERVEAAAERYKDLAKEKEKSQEESDGEPIPSVVADGFLAETVKKGGAPIFAIWNDGELKYKDQIKFDGENYAPYWDAAAEKGAVKLPTEAKEYDEVSDLIDEIKEFIHEWVDFSEQFEELAAWYVLLTWVHDKISTLPYLRFLGDWGTGKTRAVKTIGGLCYKAIDTAGATTAAAIERMVERWGGTLLMNEADFRYSDTDTNMVKILNEGFESTGCIIKAHKERQKEVVVTNPYSPKILATRRRWNDQALESRCLTETMSETDRDDILPVLTDDFYERQEELRNKLLMFRFKNYREIEENDVKEIWAELQDMNLDRRLVQATINFSVLFWGDEGMFNRFVGFLEDYQQELTTERANTHEGKVADCINEILKDEGRLTPSNIAERLEDKHNYDDVAASSVGKWLKRLGLSTKVKRINGGTKRVVENDLKEILKVLNRYVPGEIVEIEGKIEDFEADSVSPVSDVSGVTDSSADKSTRDKEDKNSNRVRNARNKRNTRNNEIDDPLLGKILDDYYDFDGSREGFIKESTDRYDISEDRAENAISILEEKEKITFTREKLEDLETQIAEIEGLEKSGD